MSNVEDLKKDILAKVNPEKAAFFPKFFKTGKGEYGEGDKFAGVTVPDVRKSVKQFKDLSLEAIRLLLCDPIHEFRLAGIFLLVQKIQNSDPNEKNEIAKLYLENVRFVNNWDLVDSSAPYILGSWVDEFGDDSILFEFAHSDNLWKQRIAMLSTFHFIKKGEFDLALSVAEILKDHKHDLIHKAVGWMLREIGKRNLQVEKKFLDAHYKTLPRTLLRYAIEKMEDSERKRYLAS